MKLIRNKYVLNTLSFISLSILLLNIFNNAVNVHSHKLENGEIVTHAHPFNHQNNDSPFESHSHTNFEFLVLVHLNTFLISSFSFVVLAVILFLKKDNYKIKSLQKQSYLCFKKNKSPPFKIVYIAQ